MEFVWIVGMLTFGVMAIVVVFAFVKVKKRDRDYYETGQLDD